MNEFSGTYSARCCAAVLAAISLLPQSAMADDGHGHGEAPVAEATASPRMEAHSDLFELVGIVDKGQLVIYLDRFATNEPVERATIAYEAGTEKGEARAQPDGTYVAAIKAMAGNETLSIAFTVTAGADADLLAGDLVLAEAHHDGHGEEAKPLARWAAYAAAALSALLILGFAARKFSGRKEAA
jgi:cobalt-zinc-cadmium efflux system membrane fusion protein